MKLPTRKPQAKQSNHKGKITNRVRGLRKSKTSFTQADFGAAVGATRQTIIAIEAGKYAPSMELAFRIALALNEPFESVFQFDPPDDKGE